MSNTPFRVDQIDHVELTVPDPYEAAKWYDRILGFRIVPELEYWADGGPLMLQSAHGETKLALFRGTPPEQVTGFKTVAFRVTGAGFLAFLNRLEAHPVTDRAGRRQTPDYTVDHDGAFSIYFVDPWGYPYEVTTYDVEPVKAQWTR